MSIRKHRPMTDVDLHAGKQLRYYRKLRGMSQNELAGRLGITFQQIQKYELGHNRISIGTLWDLSHILKAPLTDFFPVGEPLPPVSFPSKELLEFFEPFSGREVKTLLRAFELLKRDC